MLDRFTDRARKIMRLANQEAQRFGHEYIGTEHLLLGLVKEGTGVAANAIRNLGVDLRKIRLEVEKLILSGPDPVSGNLPQTPRAKRVIEFAIKEARQLNHNYIGTEHLLLGLLREQEGVAACVLTNLGLTLEAVHAEILRILSGANDPRERGVGDESDRVTTYARYAEIDSTAPPFQPGGRQVLVPILIAIIAFLSVLCIWLWLH